MLWAARLLARMVGLVWELASRLRRRSAPDPAEELRRKLAEVREREVTEEARAPLEAPAEGVVDFEGTGLELPPTEAERLRNEVRARARTVTEEMHGTSGSE